MVAIFMAATKDAGMTICFPDVCKVPAPPAPFAPAPFPNKGDLSGASKTSTKVKFKKKAAFTMKSKISRSMGDEGGTLKGMISAKNMDQCTPKMGSGSVKVEGAKIVRQTSMFGHNGSNANMPAGCHAKPCQTKVKVAAS